MILKKLIIGIFSITLLSGCAQNVAILGPAYTMVTTGNMVQSGLTYGSNAVITQTTGKSTTQNIKELLAPKKDDNEFQKLVKKRIIETRKKLNLTE
ncbi:hypothetical protein OAB83_00715 [Candidatus Pelagibacter sp.]|nr:hypothetical protein [Candidatus Pelagibacter sp.]